MHILSVRTRASSINKTMVGANFRLTKKDEHGNKYFAQTIEDEAARNKFAIGVDYIMSEMYENVECFIEDSNIVIKVLNV